MKLLLGLVALAVFLGAAGGAAAHTEVGIDLDGDGHCDHDEVILEAPGLPPPIGPHTNVCVALP